MQTETALEMPKGSRGRRGRKDSSGQEQVFDKDALLDNVDELVRLCHAAQEAATDFGEAVKATAEKAGVNAATVRKFIVAKAGEKYEETKQKALQLALVFEEVA